MDCSKVFNRPHNGSTGSLHSRLEQHSGSVQSVAFSPDGSYLVSGGHPNTIQVWDPFTGDLVYVLEGHVNGVQSLSFSPDGAILASGGGSDLGKHQTILLWDLIAGFYSSTPINYTDNVISLGHSPDGSMIATVGGIQDYTLNLWDADTGDHLRELEGHEGHARKLAFSLDGSKLASGGLYGIIHLWDPISGNQLKTFEGHKGTVHNLAFSPDGSILVSTGEKTIYLWDVDSGQLHNILEGHTYHNVLSVAFSPRWICISFRRA